MPTYTDLDRPAQFLKGVGPKRADILARMKLLTARDVLYHVPHRYEDASTVTRIKNLAPGMDCTIVGRVAGRAGGDAHRGGLRRAGHAAPGGGAGGARHRRVAARLPSRRARGNRRHSQDRPGEADAWQRGTVRANASDSTCAQRVCECTAHTEWDASCVTCIDPSCEAGCHTQVDCPTYAGYPGC